MKKIYLFCTTPLCCVFNINCCDMLCADLPDSISKPDSSKIETIHKEKGLSSSEDAVGDVKKDSLGSERPERSDEYRSELNPDGRNPVERSPIRTSSDGTFERGLEPETPGCGAGDNRFGTDEDGNDKGETENNQEENGLAASSGTGCGGDFDNSCS